MAATLSLEPLRHALPSLKSEASDAAAAAAAAATPDQQSLAARLQRLWQERGDFSKLSIDKLVQEANEEGGEDDKREELLKTAKDSNENVDQEAEEQQQSMSQEQLWDLKLGILQGLECVVLRSHLLQAVLLPGLIHMVLLAPTAWPEATSHPPWTCCSCFSTRSMRWPHLSLKKLWLCRRVACLPACCIRRCHRQPKVSISEIRRWHLQRRLKL